VMSDSSPDPALDLLLNKAHLALAPYLALNPKSTIESFVSKAGLVGVQITWGDKSLALQIPDDVDQFATIMNNLALPERLSAVWHQNQASLEFIWTAFPLSPNWQEVKGRSFTFRFEGTTHECALRESSRDLLAIAKQMRQRQNTNTSFRNLDSYRVYSQTRDVETPSLSCMEPLSFWKSHIN
jgi:hypothetical protein